MTLTSSPPNAQGYRSYSIGSFTFSRDEYFATIEWPTGSHQMAVDAFLRCVQRDVAWGFFYGIVNFDSVFGTMNHYGNVDMFAGRFNDAYRRAEVDYNENFPHDELLGCFESLLSDWTNEGYDPFAAPMETGSAFGPSNGSNDSAVTRHRVIAQRMVGIPGDEQIRSDDSGFPVNRGFADVAQHEPQIEAEAGYEDEVCSFNLFAYLSRSDVTWNPFGRVCVQGKPLLPDYRGVHPAGHPWQRSRRVVCSAQRRNPMGRGRSRHRREASEGHHEGRRRGRDARRHSPPGLLAQAFHAARVGERLAAHPRDDRQGRGISSPSRVLRGAPQ